MVLLTSDRPLLIAYIEDKKDDVDAFVESFRAHGFMNQVDCYESAEEFLLEQASPFPKVPDVALVDLALPGISGQELMQVMKANPALAGIPVFIVTASDLSVADAVSRLVGASHRCQKPLRAPNLLEMLLDSNRHGLRFGLQLVMLETASRQEVQRA